MLTRTRTAALAAAALLALTGGIVPALANAPAECVRTAAGQVCSVTASPPGRPGTVTPVKGGTPARPAACEDSFPITWCAPPPAAGAWWSPDRECWIAPLTPSPPHGDPMWKGNTTGAIYLCWPPETPAFRGTGNVTYFWSAAPPPQVDPAVLAEAAVESMDLQPPAVGATPLPSPDAVSLIGLPTWLWIEAPGEHSWGPITRTAAAGGVTVTATAQVTKVVWDMGDGGTVTCTGQGTKWSPAMGAGDSPDCGYRYRTAGRRTITATTYWQVAWSGAGQSGTIALDMSGTRPVDVVELRAVISG